MFLLLLHCTLQWLWNSFSHYLFFSSVCHFSSALSLIICCLSLSFISVLPLVPPLSSVSFYTFFPDLLLLHHQRLFFCAFERRRARRREIEVPPSCSTNKQRGLMCCAQRSSVGGPSDPAFERCGERMQAALASVSWWIGQLARPLSVCSWRCSLSLAIAGEDEGMGRDQAFQVTFHHLLTSVLYTSSSVTHRSSVGPSFGLATDLACKFLIRVTLALPARDCF